MVWMEVAMSQLLGWLQFKEWNWNVDSYVDRLVVQWSMTSLFLNQYDSPPVTLALYGYIVTSTSHPYLYCTYFCISWLCTCDMCNGNKVESQSKSHLNLNLYFKSSLLPLWRYYIRNKILIWLYCFICWKAGPTNSTFNCIIFCTIWFWFST